MAVPEKKPNDWQLLPPGNIQRYFSHSQCCCKVPTDMFYFVSDIPIEMFIIVTTGIVIIIAVIIVTIVIKCTCNNNRTPQESFPHFDANTIPPNYGYTASKAHQKSSWACTFKGGQQVNTHIWEAPLPEPQHGEYTLPEIMKKQLGMGGQPDQNQIVRESAGIGATSHLFFSRNASECESVSNPSKS